VRNADANSVVSPWVALVGNIPMLASRLNGAQHRQRRRRLALLRPKPPAVRGQALAGVACRRRQKKYESPQSTAGAGRPAPRLRAIAHREMSAEARSMTKPA
jgi:hypothetical protein